MECQEIARFDRLGAVIVFVASFLAGCVGAPPAPATTAGDSGEPGRSTGPAEAPSVSATALAIPGGGSMAPGATPDNPTEPIDGTGPPPARLGPPGEPGVAGDIGSFSWDGLSSDAPWIVGMAKVIAEAGQSLEVRTEPAIPVGEWWGRWAPVTASQPGDSRPGGDGSGAPIVVSVPAAGEWSVQVTVELADSGRVTYYWRVTVSP